MAESIRARIVWGLLRRSVEPTMPLDHDVVERLRGQFQTSPSKISGAVASIAYQCGDERDACVIGRQPETSASFADTDSRFLVMSITKSLTAVAVLRLAEAGKMELDGPLSRWMPEFSNASRITMRHLLQHTSGLPDYGPLASYHEAVRRGERPWTFDEFLDRTNAEELLFEPGTEFRYSNIGYMLLRRVIEQASNRSFAETITVEVCRPLDLEHTAVIESHADMQYLIPGYSRSLAETGSPEVDVRTRYDPDWIATGVVASTAAEIVRFYRGLFSGGLLSPASFQEMCRIRRAVATHPRYTTPSYGLGLMADPDWPCGAMHGHNGAGPGYSASAFHFHPFPNGSSRDVTVAVLCNMENTDQTERMMLALADHLGS